MPILYLLLSVGLIILLTVRWRVHPFAALVLVALGYGLLAGMPLNELTASVNTGFGNTLGGIGLIIILGVIIGAFLEHSGGAYALAEWVLRLTGRERVPEAMGLLGWVVSIPVFADSGFMLLIPLAKSLSKRAGKTLAGAAIALALGLMASHTLVPPTPGPVAAAYYLAADIGLVMLFGIPVSLIALLLVQLFVRRVAERVYIDPAPDLTEAEIRDRLEDAPGAALTAVPLVVPILLIVIGSVLGSFFGYAAEDFSSHPAGIRMMLFLGTPFIALIVGCFLALLLPRRLESTMFTTDGWIGQALVGAAGILLITGAGGIFGQVLRDSGIATLLGETLAEARLGIWLPFLLAAAIKTAQGSSTVALITAASILAPMLGELGFEREVHRALVVVAIGAGSSVVVHANDSFFWVVTRMSGLDVRQGYRLLSLGSLCLGFTAALLTFFLYLIV